MSDETLDRSALLRLERLGGAKLLRQMINLYLEHGPGRVQAIADGVAASRDAAAIERAAHTLKSSAGNLGALRLQHTAEALEAVAASGIVDEQLAQRVQAEYAESEAGTSQHTRGARDMIRIALVEDNPDNRLLAQAILEEHYEIDEYESGSDALAGLRRSPCPWCCWTSRCRSWTGPRCSATCAMTLRSSTCPSLP
jgi:HPt (histidine-containing phosphotransfer) domain-containing protein